MPTFPRPFRAARIFQLSLAVAATFVASNCRAQTPATSAIHDGDRVVFVGDSITGQGRNAEGGWARLIEETLRQTHAAQPPILVSLGGSGQGAESWRGVEERSRNQNFKLDVPDVDVRDELRKPADVLVIMLGTNDVLSPYITDTPEGYDKWTANYRALIGALRERLHPRVVGLATIPLVTEDPNSPKNRAIAALNGRLTQIAVDEKALLLPVNASLWQTLQNGRALKPNFHVTGDFVHPNDAGHIAIAQGMLRGLGEPTTLLQRQHLAPLWKNSAPALPALSYQMETVPGALDAARQTYKIHYDWTAALPGEAAPASAPPSAPVVTLQLPAGWSATPPKITAQSGTFVVTGRPEMLHNRLTLKGTEGATARASEIDIAPPWLVGAGNVRQIGWSPDNSSFDPVKGHLDADDRLIAGKGWGKPLELAPATPLTWALWTPSVDYLGGAKEGNVDMAGVAFFQLFEVGYGTRWIYSARARTVRFRLGTQANSDNSHLALWMNGENRFAGQLNEFQGKIVEANLNPGWNQLVFKSNHLRWQWQFSIDLVEPADDDLSDLRFAVAAARQ